MKKPLYSTIVRNDEGLEGRVYVVDGLEVQTSSPMNKKAGTNPEQLFGLAWSTCLNASIEYAIKKRRLREIASEVEIRVDYLKEANTDQTYFGFDVNVYIDLPQDLAEEIAAEAHNRCPVSKIVNDYPHVKKTIKGKNQ